MKALFIIGGLLLTIGVIIGLHEKHEERKRIESVTKRKTESAAKAKVNTIPEIYTEYHLLKKGEVIRVKVPSGYSHTCAGGGKKYYYQAQNASKPIICGGGGYIDVGEHVAYFDLFYYDEEIIVVCEFKKL